LLISRSNIVAKCLFYSDPKLGAANEL
jgi:hypothetical protein